jgi:putative proteasome-type protease
LSVGLPIDLAVYKEGTLRSDDVICIDEQNPYFTMIRSTWGRRLREVFDSIEDPQWGAGQSQYPLRCSAGRFESLRKITHPSEKLV